MTEVGAKGTLQLLFLQRTVTIDGIKEGETWHLRMADDVRENVQVMERDGDCDEMYQSGD